MASSSNTVAGHPIAMKVGGRRVSLSKSPSATKSHLSTSPNAGKDALISANKDKDQNPHGQPAPPVSHPVVDKLTPDTTTNDIGAPQKETPTSPTSDQYPRPTPDHPQRNNSDKDKDANKEDNKKEEDTSKNSKKTPIFDKNIGKGKDVYNKHPPAVNNFNIKQPAGKVMV